MKQENEKPQVANSFATENTNETKTNLFLLEGKRCKTRCLTVLTKFMVVVLFVFSFTSCESSERPVEEGRLPFGVFPLNDVKWVEFDHYTSGMSGTHNHKWHRDTVTYSIHQINENRAELHLVKKKTTGIPEFDPNDPMAEPIAWFEDSIWFEPNRLYGWITIEDNRVYYESVGPDDTPIYNSLMYDFNLRLYDTFTVINPINNEFVVSAFVVSIDSVLIGNEYRRRYKFIYTYLPNGKEFYDLYGYYSYSVIEGIGNDKSFLHTLLNPAPKVYVQPNLISVYYRDKIIWKNSLEWGE